MEGNKFCLKIQGGVGVELHRWVWKFTFYSRSLSTHHFLFRVLIGFQRWHGLAWEKVLVDFPLHVHELCG